MKGFAIVLLCFVAVQARYTSVVDKTSRTEAAQLGDSPWLVHLRVAVGTSGFLTTCAGSLIDNAWVLTSASCVDDARFIWIRYGAVNVISPQLVTETSTVWLHPDWDSATGDNNVALISVNRDIPSTDNIQQISLSDATADSAVFCAYGAGENNVPGQTLQCSEVNVEVNDNTLHTDTAATEFDLGAPLVSDGVQIGLLVDPSGEFLRPALYQDWINEVTGRVDSRLDAVKVVNS